MQSLTLAHDHFRAGRTAAAIALVNQALSADPNDAHAIHLLGLFLAKSDPAAAEQHLRRSIQLAADVPDFSLNLAKFLQSQNRLNEAVAAYRNATDLAPTPDLLNNLGLLYQQLNRLNDAIDCFRACIELNPNLPAPYSNLGIALASAGGYQSAIDCFTEALRLDPNLAPAHSNLAIALKELGRLDEAIDHAATAVHLSPGDTAALCTMGDAFKDQARLDDAIKCFRKAIALDPSDRHAYDSLLYTMFYHPNFSPRDIYNEHKEWSRRFAEPLACEIKVHDNDRDPDRRLRIAYVSPDFRQHSLGLLIEPILAHHDHKNFTIICYSDVKRPDAITQKIKSHVDFLEPTAGLSDADLADRIRRDKIDILIDLTNHMQDNRLLTFARKPAPIQATYLAYPETTGLATMDYLITDAHLHPPDSTVPSSEQLIRLPETYWAYPNQPDVPDVAPLPALTNNHITFGCLNNFCKLNDAVLSLWRILLTSIPTARLHLLINSRDGNYELNWLESLGLSLDRITLLQKQPRNKYLNLFNSIDISLDPFPCTGHTTSLDSLYMGVPVLTLPGQSPFSRATLSQLTNLNLPDFIASSKEDYILLAKAHSSDLPRLANLRSKLRDQMLSSPLCDAARLTRHLERACQMTWRQWCGSTKMA